MTYLDLVNAVLRRLREEPVTSVVETDYAQLIGSFVNDAIRMVALEHQWSVFYTVISVNTVTGASELAIPDTNTNSSVYYVKNASTDKQLQQSGFTELDDLLTRTVVDHGEPIKYDVLNVNANGELVLRLWPIPDAVYTLKVSALVEAGELVNDTDITSLPSNLIILAATAKALEERGEDTGANPNTLWNQYERQLGFEIAKDVERKYGNYDLIFDV